MTGFLWLRIWTMGFLLCWSAIGSAEPWLSTRFAQNCSGCHAPGRVNLPPAERRCTLSCQGCHINPNGGGFRSQYGKWNEERWLRSFVVPLQQFRNQRTAVATPKQHYGNWVAQGAAPKEKEKEKDKDKDVEKDGNEKSDAPVDAKKKKRVANEGYALVTSDDIGVDEKPYDRSDGRERIIVDSKEDFLYQMPKDDPYRQLGLTRFDGGGGARWQVYSGLGDSTKWSSFLMDVDLGLRWRPIYRNLHLVYETRFFGAPPTGQTVVYEDMFKQSTTRSLYAMIDDLPYNIFVMGGWYLPLFGNFSPDHRALAQKMISFAQAGTANNYGLLYNSVSAGTAPNVPYLNVHLIQKRIGDVDDRTKGFAANSGLRFVTLGASVNYSYWRTTDDRGASGQSATEMHSIGAAAKLGPTVTGLDFVSLARDATDKDFRQGGVTTLDTYTKIWREFYFTAQLARANTTADLKPGEGMQTRIGLRAFLIPGVDIATAYESNNENTKNTTTDAVTSVKSSAFTTQMNMFF